MAASKDAPVPKTAHEACVNCGKPGTVSTDGKTANKLSFCDRHAPAGLK